MSLIRSVLAYSSQIREADEDDLLVFELKNPELQFNDPYIIDFIKLERFSWTGHVMRMQKKNFVERFMRQD